MNSAKLHALGQDCLFSDHLPDGTEIPIAQRPITRGCLLPLPANQMIDITRACNIFDVQKTTVIRLVDRKHIRGYRLALKNAWSIELNSVIEFCDKLRLEHCIADRRPARKLGRWRDEDILPFHRRDTIDVAQAMLALDARHSTILKLCEEGCFDCYRLGSQKHVPWRISKTSLFIYAERLKAKMREGFR